MRYKYNDLAYDYIYKLMIIYTIYKKGYNYYNYAKFEEYWFFSTKNVWGVCVRLNSGGVCFCEVNRD
jgi:hypothetical protein